MSNNHSGMITPATLPHGVHLVGSIPLSNTEEVFRTASSILGDRLVRLPDGETGERSGWITWQYRFLVSNPQFESAPPEPDSYAPHPRVRLRNPVASNMIHFEQLGYADAAQTSYALFSQLKREGILPESYRFQVSLPTPIAPTIAFIAPEDQAVVEPAYEAAMLAEINKITDVIPAHELAIQWDTAIEFGMLERNAPIYSKEEILTRLTRIGDYVPDGVELGYHLCYGDSGHKHFMEPEDTSLLVEVANGILAGVPRKIHWIHMPVPRNRTDEAYFAPLRTLKLPPETKLYLGLVHYTDGVEGTLQRIEAARQVIADFGVATECGMGRRPPETIPDLLRIHSAVATSA